MHRHEGLQDPRRKGMSSDRAAGIWQEQCSRLLQGTERGCPVLQGAVATCWHQHRANQVAFQNLFAPEPSALPDNTGRALGGLSRSAARVGKRETGWKGCRLSSPGLSTRLVSSSQTRTSCPIPQGHFTADCTTLLCPALPGMPAQPLRQQCHDKFLKRGRTM